MDSLFRMRVFIRAGVGSLARVTRAIEQLGGTISTFDLQGGTGDVGVCDIAVRLRSDVANEDTVGDALRQEKAGVLAGLHPIDHAVDSVVRAMRWASNMMGDSSMADDEMRRVIGEICATPDAWLLSLDEALEIDAAKDAARKWAPVITSAPSTPNHLEGSFRGPVTMLAVPNARLEPTMVALIVRPAAQLYTGTEIDRVEAILGFRRRAIVLDTRYSDSSDPSSWFDTTHA